MSHPCGSEPKYGGSLRCFVIWGKYGGREGCETSGEGGASVGVWRAGVEEEGRAVEKTGFPGSLPITGCFSMHFIHCKTMP